MTLINLTTIFGGAKPLNSTCLSPVGFKGSEKFAAFNFEGLDPNNDRFVTNPTGRQNKTKTEVEQLAKSSPRIMQLLKENNLPLHANVGTFNGFEPKGHYSVTRVIAAKVYSELSEELKKQVNLANLQEAALLHDYGKILIPKEILDKKGALTPEEKKIMELHSEFGYELLKQMGTNEEVLNLVKYHHQSPDGKGYPPAGRDYENNISLQILIAADKYSALTEERCYHKAYTKEAALEIIAQDAENGLISHEVFEALNKAVK